MPRPRVTCIVSIAVRPLTIVVVATLAVSACAAPSRALEAAVQSTPVPTPSPPYEPGPDQLIGRVIGLTPIGPVIDTGGERTTVDLSSARDVWMETSTSAAAIQVGDELDVNGVRSDRVFIARYVWANIGRLDGIVRTIDGDHLVVAYERSGSAPQEARVDLSRYVEIVRLVGSSQVAGSRADLVPGARVGMVLYRPRDGIPRATRIWLPASP